MKYRHPCESRTRTMLGLQFEILWEEKCLKEAQENTELAPLPYSCCFCSHSPISRQHRRTDRNSTTKPARSATARMEPEIRLLAKQSGRRIWVRLKPRS